MCVHELLGVDKRVGVDGWMYVYCCSEDGDLYVCVLVVGVEDVLVVEEGVDGLPEERVMEDRFIFEVEYFHDEIIDFRNGYFWDLLIVVNDLLKYF